LDEMQREVDDAFELIWEGLFYHYDQSIESIVTMIWRLEQFCVENHDDTCESSESVNCFMSFVHYCGVN